MTARRTILLVEDEPDLRDAVAAVLRRHGYDVTATGDGAEAAELLDRDLPDLALFDMMLPGRSGFHLTRRVKELSDEQVPVIMMSGNTSAAHRDYAFAAGVDRFLPKPFLFHALTDLARALCPPGAGVRGESDAVAARP